MRVLVKITKPPCFFQLRTSKSQLFEIRFCPHKSYMSLIPLQANFRLITSLIVLHHSENLKQTIDKCLQFMATNLTFHRIELNILQKNILITLLKFLPNAISTQLTKYMYILYKQLKPNRGAYSSRKRVECRVLLKNDNQVCRPNYNFQMIKPSLDPPPPPDRHQRSHPIISLLPPYHLSSLLPNCLTILQFPHYL